MRFVPLESNPDVFNEYLKKLGVEGEFSDVFSLDEDMLAFVPRPVHALLLVFPVSKTYEEYRHSADSSIEPWTGPGGPLWAPQTIGNACGTMALLHAIGNGIPKSALGHGIGARIIGDLTPLTASERAKYLEDSSELAEVHASVAGNGDTEAPGAEASVEAHYVCLTRDEENNLVELDGRRKGPIFRGKLESDDVLGPLAVSVVREFMDREESPNFSIIAMS